MDRAHPPRRRLLTATAAVLVLAFSGMCWWQVTRALGGNSLSWAYVFEWPIFAGYVVYMWWRLLHEGDAPERAGAPVQSPVAPRHERAAEGAGAAPGQAAEEEAAEEEEDEELAAYNRYLAELARSGRRKRW